MSYSRERDEFISKATSEGLGLDTCRKLLRYATTLHRLAEAQCNGDWPYNGDRDRPDAKWLPCAYCDGHGKLEMCGDECPQCKGSGKSWYRDVDADRRHDARYAVCPKCEASGVAKVAMRYSSDRSFLVGELDNGKSAAVRVCPDCRTQELVQALLTKAAQHWADYWQNVGKHPDEINAICDNGGPLKPIFQGDPRGAVLLLSTPDYPWTEDGRGRGLYVPARGTR